MWYVFIGFIIIVVIIAVVRNAPELDRHGNPRNSTCESCGSNDTKHGSFWARGWNDLCEQAYSDDGIYCKRCSHVTFDQPLDEHLKTLPDWCRPYR